MSRLRPLVCILFVVFISFEVGAQTKTDQLKYPRVRAAYADAEAEIKALLAEHEIDQSTLRLYFRAFKEEGRFEIWAKNVSDEEYRLIKTYDICAKSGDLGPKRRQGDYQVPEGFYHIDRFNPSSSYYLSLGINYPNLSDRKLSDQARPGGDIFIHGECVTIGCLPMTNPVIKRIYVLCLEAKTAGQTTIPITLFPAKLDTEKYHALTNDSKYSAETKKLWENLKRAYDLFNAQHKLPNIQFLSDGNHRVSGN